MCIFTAASGGRGCRGKVLQASSGKRTGGTTTRPNLLFWEARQPYFHLGGRGRSMQTLKVAQDTPTPTQPPPRQNKTTPTPPNIIKTLWKSTKGSRFGKKLKSGFVNGKKEVGSSKNPQPERGLNLCIWAEIDGCKGIVGFTWGGKQESPHQQWSGSHIGGRLEWVAGIKLHQGRAVNQTSRSSSRKIGKGLDKLKEIAPRQKEKKNDARIPQKRSTKKIDKRVMA